MRRQYTVDELDELVTMPESELEPAERRAVMKYRRSHGPVSVNAGGKPAPAEPRTNPRVELVAAPAPMSASMNRSRPRALHEGIVSEARSVSPAESDGHSGLVEFVGETLPEDAVVSNRAVPKWRWEAVELRTRPKVWAHLVEKDTRKQATYMACSIRSGKLVAFAPGGLFDAAVRTLPDGSHHVYARYLGEES
ncbi:MAG: hypothetical protein ABF966_00050 [Bifidobacterium psychraerophilum]|uniref:hypothetical protein n=1 Tax=Bifidobacterium psychraerophilum TaxID=218140 RepID=UPI0039EC0014